MIKENFEFEVDDVVGFTLQLGRPIYRVRVALHIGYVTPLWVGKKVILNIIRYIENNEEFLEKVECEIIGFEQENKGQYIHAREI